jgi:hypothetical protein
LSISESFQSFHHPLHFYHTQVLVLAKYFFQSILGSKGFMISPQFEFIAIAVVAITSTCGILSVWINKWVVDVSLFKPM